MRGPSARSLLPKVSAYGGLGETSLQRSFPPNFTFLKAHWYRKEAGCFVLITNEPFESEGGMSSLELLRLYKDQHSIEQNFGFLKDPLIVNALFLKSPKRIEALGLILVLALMVWRLMERTMRMSLRESGSKVTGWSDTKPTSRPTSFMMTTKFLSIIVLRLGGRRRPGNPLRTVQADYLRILGLSSDVFVNPEARMCRGVVSRLQ